METKNVLLALRTEKGLSQDELAEKLFVTRQAVSRWQASSGLPSRSARIWKPWCRSWRTGRSVLQQNLRISLRCLTARENCDILSQQFNRA